ncbi:MAG: TlpA family protein disulfide reductase, partial [Planctomycetota bacterium]
MRIHILSLLILCTGLAAALEVGQPAPALGDPTWIKGEAPTLDDGEQWTVVEFWATWCGPCRTSIPHLTRLQEEYADSLTIVGLSNEDTATVRPFVENMGADMAYAVGADAQQAYQSYMAGISGIPHAFLVDPTGVVAWHGHPMQMDSILE